MTDKQLVLLGGAAALAVGLIFVVLRIRFLRRAVTTEGTVTGYDETTDSEGGTSYRPIVNFQTADGQAIQFTHSVGGSKSAYPFGETVPVKYLSSKPQEAKIGTPTSLWWAPTLFAVVGVGLLVWGFFFLEGNEGAAETSANVPSLARTLPSGQTRISVVNQSDSRVLTADCVSIRDSQPGTLGIRREVSLQIEGNKTLILRVDSYTGPKAYTGPIGASVSGTIFEGGQSPSGAVVFSGNGQNGVVNVSAPPLSVSGNWDCTAEELQRS